VTRLIAPLAFGLVALASATYPLVSRSIERRERGVSLQQSPLEAGSRPPLNPAYAPALRQFWGRSSSLTPRVGIQVGHWKHDELPPELVRLRDATGAQSGAYREVDINLAVARSLAELLGSAGVATDLLPATVPPSYLADAVVAIHADGAARVTARGWKMSTPWRASAASRMLLDSVAQSYGEITGLPEDRYGITYGMKGYYAFSPQRVLHAVSPFTPCIIVETGFVTVAADRAVIADRPELVARAIAVGVLRFLGARPRAVTPDGRLAYLPPSYPVAVVAAEGSELRAYPSPDERIVRRLERGTMVMPMQLRGDWAEVVVRGNFRSFGWVRRDELGPMG